MKNKQSSEDESEEIGKQIIDSFKEVDVKGRKDRSLGKNCRNQGATGKSQSQ